MNRELHIREVIRSGIRVLPIRSKMYTLLTPTNISNLVNEFKMLIILCLPKKCLNRVRF